MKLYKQFIMYNQNLLMLKAFLIKEAIMEIKPFFFLIWSTIPINLKQKDNITVRVQQLMFE